MYKYVSNDRCFGVICFWVYRSRFFFVFRDGCDFGWWDGSKFVNNFGGFVGFERDV